MLELSASNVIAWMEQAFVLAAAGSLLPLLFRIRHPWTKLAYCHALLATCLFLPLMQPWKHPVIVRQSGVGQSAAQTPGDSSTQQISVAQTSPSDLGAVTPAPIARLTIPNTIQQAAFSKGRLILWLLVAGILLKLCWLLGGLLRIRQHRIASMPLYPIPESVRAAVAIAQADALFCISSDIPGPVMLGWLTPVVLLPESFLAMSEEAQCGIACHELLHVRRHDWLVTLLEELAGTLLWFNPAIWLLLAQTRLAREQLVDAEAVRLTASREPYIDALLAIARGGPGLDLAPAPLFLRRRHLTQRVHLLLKDASASTLSLVTSYASMAAMLALAAWLGAASFPLTGSPVFRDTPREVAAAVTPASAPQSRVSNAPNAAADVPLSAPEESPAPPPAAGQLDYIPSAPVPPDPRELVTGPVRALTSPRDRAAAIALFERARQNSRLHNSNTWPYRFDVSFSANGNALHTGTGRLTEINVPNQALRWTADLGGYSLVRVNLGDQKFESQHVSTFPMRVQMLRNAILWTIGPAVTNAQIRSTQAHWNGRAVTCLLLSRMAGTATLTQARLWEEDEICIDNASGLVQTYSIAPGTYIVYGYGRNLQFHDQFLPDRITIYSAGAMVIDADFNIEDASSADKDLLKPVPGLLPGSQWVSPETHTRFQIKTPSPLSSKLVQPVIVHAEIGGDGSVVEEELSAASDPALARAALDLIKHTTLPHTPLTQRQAYINVRFMPPAGTQ